MLIINNVEQNTPEWMALKAGVPSASNFDKIVTTKGVRSKSAEKYMFQLAGEKVTGIREEGYQNASMLRGIEMEAEAVELYELGHVGVEKVGVCYLNEDKKILCSPDRIIVDPEGGIEGLLEIKCPEIQTHVGYLLANKLPTAYFQQIHGQMLVTGALYCSFMSYYPGLKPFIYRVERDEVFIKALAFELDLFVKELDIVVNKIK